MKDDPPGATPLNPDEVEGLRQRHITTRDELNELEQANVQLGLEWATRIALGGSRRRDVLTESFLFDLHERMFGEVWTWAGRVRKTNKNIGIDWTVIRPALRDLIEDARLWRDRGVYGPDEIAVRFHHRLVSIHPFPNGNGRHSRMMADLIALQLGRPRFTWGGGLLATPSDMRGQYIKALRAADRAELGPLRDFARS